MNVGIYNRDVLKILPLITSRLTHVMNAVYQVASKGESRYFFEYSDTSPIWNRPIDIDDINTTHIQPQKNVKEDIQKALQLVFQNCLIEYVEGWVDTAPNIRMFKKGFIIDWS